MKSLILAVLMVGMFLGVAHAADFAANMTDGVNLFADNHTFALSDNPKLFIGMPAGSSDSFAFWFVGPSSTFDANNNSFAYSASAELFNDSYITLPWGTGNLTKAPGTWTAQVNHSPFDIDDCPSKTLHFNFAPEPISASLFLLGGAGLAFYRKRSKA